MSDDRPPSPNSPLREFRKLCPSIECQRREPGMPLSILSNIAREAPLGSLELPSPADDCGGTSRAVCFDKLHSGRTFRCEWQASLHPPYQ